MKKEFGSYLPYLTWYPIFILGHLAMADVDATLCNSEGATGRDFN